MAKRAYRAADFLRTDPNNHFVTTIMKLDHPHRLQRVMVVPVPRHGRKEYFTDWVYQPYIKDHVLVFAPELYHGFNTYVPQLLIWQNQFPGIDFYRPSLLPDPVDVNMSRPQFTAKTRHWFASFVAVAMLPQRFRDKRHPWIRKNTQRMLGTRYLVHPAEEEQSYVLLIPATQAHSAVNAMTELGFNVVESLDVDVGDKKAIESLNLAGEVGEAACLLYIYSLIILVTVGAARLLHVEYRKWMREQIAKEGHDPAKYGY